jgi:predicted metal-dependent hydrolase
MAAPSPTPADLEITPRNLSFSKGEPHPRWWLGGDPVGTALFNAFSATFPHGERYFIDSVKAFRDQVDAPLKRQIQAFVQQESMHSREHALFNRQAAETGYDLTALEERSRQRMEIARTRPPVVQLAVTAALEHFTAIIAHTLLTRPEVLAGAPAEAARLWRWHSIEEIEHKAVAYDVLLAVTQGMSGWRRWRMRARVMVLVTILFVRNMSKNVAELMRQDGFEPRKMRGKTLKYLFLTPGLLSGLIPHYLAWFQPGFHPWQQDDRAVLAAAEGEFATVVAAE